MWSSGAGMTLLDVLCFFVLLGLSLLANADTEVIDLGPRGASPRLPKTVKRYDSLPSHVRSVTAFPRSKPGVVSSTLYGLVSAAQGANDAILRHLNVGESLPPSACQDRLDALKSLVAEQFYEEALSMAFQVTAADRSALSGKSCALEELYDGAGDVQARIHSMSKRVGKKSSRQSFVNLPGRDASLVLKTYGDRTYQRSHGRVPLHGFILDGDFVATSSPLRCLSSRERKQAGVDDDGGARALYACHTGFSVKNFASRAEIAAASTFEFMDGMSDGETREYEVDAKGGGDDHMRNLEATEIPLSMHTLGESYALGNKKVIIAVGCPVDENDPTHCQQGLDNIFEMGDHWKTMRDDPSLNPEGKSAFELHLEHAIANVTSFYETQSWGQYTIDFHVLPEVIELNWDTHQITKQRCLCLDGSRECYGAEETDLLGAGLPKVKEFVEENIDVLIGPENEAFKAPDNYGMIVPRCFASGEGGWAGIAWLGIPGFIVRWGGAFSNGAGDDGNVFAHEVGHNIGMDHDSFGSVEYGNPFSVMGHGPLPEAHFQGAGKGIFEWLKHEPTSEVTIGSVDNDLCLKNVQCQSRLKLGEALDLKLQPVDDGTLEGGKAAVVRIVTDIPNHYYFLEWRNAYAASDNNLELNSGLMIYFGTTYARSSEISIGYGFGMKSGTGTLGPTNVLHMYDAGTPNQWEFSYYDTPPTFFDYLKDATLPEGQSYVIDLDEVGLIVSVNSIDSHAREMNVQVQFAQRGSSNYEVDNVLSCSAGAQAMTSSLSRIDVPRSVTEYEMQDGSTQTMLSQTEYFDIKFDICSALSGGGATAYVYSDYPLHVFAPFNSDKAIGAIATQQIDCNGGASSIETADGCNGAGFCLQTGYTQLDACDYKEVEGTNSFVSTQAGAALCYRNGKWTLGTSCTTVYNLPELTCSWTFDNMQNIQAVLLDCLGIQGSCMASKNQLRVHVGDKHTFTNRLWDSMSREFFVLVEGVGDAEEGANVEVTCSSATCPSAWEYSTGDGCAECPHGSELAKSSVACLESPSVSTCCSPCESPSFYDDSSKSCKVKTCGFGMVGDGQGNCVSACNAEGEAFVEVEVTREGACNTLVMSFAPDGWEPFDLRLEKFETDLMDDTLLAFRGEAQGMEFTFDCWMGPFQNTLCGLTTDYTDLYMYSQWAVCENYTGLRTISEGCYGAGSTVTDYSGSSFATSWADGSTSETWCVDDFIRGAQVTAFGRPIDLDWKETSIHTATGKAGVCVDTSDVSDNRVEIESSKLGDLLAADDISIAVKHNAGKYVSEPGQSFVEIDADDLSSGIGDHSGSPTASPTLSPTMSPTYSPSSSPSPSSSSTTPSPTPSPTPAPTQSPTTNLGSLCTCYNGVPVTDDTCMGGHMCLHCDVFFALVDGSCQPDEQIENDCNYDNDCKDGKVCVVNVFHHSGSSARRLKSSLFKFKYKGEPVFKNAENGGRLTADLRNSNWSDPSTITINGEHVVVLVNYESGHVANYDKGLEVIVPLKYDKKKHKVVKGAVSSSVKTNRGNLKGGRRRLFGSTYKGKCIHIDI